MVDTRLCWCRCSSSVHTPHCSICPPGFCHAWRPLPAWQPPRSRLEDLTACLRGYRPWWRLPALILAYASALLFGVALAAVLIWTVASATT